MSKNSAVFSRIVKPWTQLENVLVEPGPSQEVVQAIFEYYLKNVYSHELFHAVGRVVPKNNKVDYHYAQDGFIMDHHMWYKESNKNKTVTWHIMNEWTKADVPLFK